MVGVIQRSDSDGLVSERARLRMVEQLAHQGIDSELVLGAMIGARPEEILLDGGWGSALGAAGVAEQWSCPHGMDARAPARRSWTYNFLYFSTPPTALGARRVSLISGTSIKDCQKTSAHR